MKKIELEQWEPFPGDPRRMQYAGQRVAQEVFEELKHRLESMGYLPDEYFLMDREWENGREIPKDADIFCTTDYGGNEGVYLDVYLKWYEDSRPGDRQLPHQPLQRAAHRGGSQHFSEAVTKRRRCNAAAPFCHASRSGPGRSISRLRAAEWASFSARAARFPEASASR